MKNPADRAGFTLVEMLLVVTIIGMMALFLTPVISLSIRNKQNALVASHLRAALTAFSMYRSEVGSVPVSRGSSVIPPEMTDYFNDLKITSWWTNTTEIGGRWAWNTNSGAAVLIIAPTVSSDQLKELDKLVDDGDLTTGNFQKNGMSYRYPLGD